MEVYKYKDVVIIEPDYKEVDKEAPLPSIKEVKIDWYELSYKLAWYAVAGIALAGIYDLFLGW